MSHAAIEHELKLMGDYIPVQICVADWYWLLGYITEEEYNTYRDEKFENAVKTYVYFKEEQMLIYSNIVQFISKDTVRYYKTDTFRRHDYYNNGLRSDYIMTMPFYSDLIRSFDEDIVAWKIKDNFRIQPLGFRTTGYDYLFCGKDNGLSQVFNKRLGYNAHVGDLSQKIYELKLEDTNSRAFEEAYQNLKLVSDGLNLMDKLMYKKEG